MQALLRWVGELTREDSFGEHTSHCRDRMGGVSLSFPGTTHDLCLCADPMSSAMSRFFCASRPPGQWQCQTWDR